MENTNNALVHTAVATRLQIDGLTGIRALAASWVVIHHFSALLFLLFPALSILSPIIAAGYLGVEIFFVLSGFIIAYTYAERFLHFSWPEFGRFVWLRLARIYPVHLVTLLAVMFMVIAASAIGHHFNDREVFNLKNFFANLIMLQAIPPFRALNGPSWSICAEFAAYMVFPVLALGIRTVRSAQAGFLYGISVLVFGSIAMALVRSFVDESPTGYGLIWLRIATCFAGGVCLYAGWRHLGALQKGIYWDWIALTSLMAAVLIVALLGGHNPLSSFAVPFLGIFVISCAGASGHFGRLLSMPFMLWGGRISYSVYMTHFILLLGLSQIIPWEMVASLSAVVRVIIVVLGAVLIIGMGFIFYTLVEEPARKFLRKGAGSLNCRH